MIQVINYMNFPSPWAIGIEIDFVIQFVNGVLVLVTTTFIHLQINSQIYWKQGTRNNP